MAQSERSSKGKGKGKQSRDYETQSISLSDYHGSYTSPRTSSMNPVHTLPQSLYQSLDQAYPQTENYCLDAHGLAYPSTGTASSQPWPDADHSSLPSEGIAGDIIDGYATSTLSLGALVPAGDVWDVQSSSASEYSTQFSHGSPSTFASSAPSRYDRDNVNTQILRQTGTSQRYDLPCEFLGCPEVFHGDQQAEWVRHTEDHLQGNFPPKLLCCKLFVPHVGAVEGEWLLIEETSLHLRVQLQFPPIRCEEPRDRR